MAKLTESEKILLRNFLNCCYGLGEQVFTAEQTDIIDYFEIENMNQYTPEELFSKKTDCLRMSDLRKFVEANLDLDDSTPVLVEHVKDIYLEDHKRDPHDIKGWDVYLQEGLHYHNQVNYNLNMEEELERRKQGLEPEFPLIEDPQEMIDLDLDKYKEVFYKANQIQKNREGTLIFIYNHI